MATEKENTKNKDATFLEWGYKTAIILSIGGLILSATYLFLFLFKSHPELIEQDTMLGFSAERRMVLLSTAIFVAMSFGFLGFALFLIQAKGEVEGSFEYKDFKVNISRMSPGLFIILCATVIIIFSVSFRIEYSQSKTPVQQVQEAKDSSGYHINQNNILPDPEDTNQNSSSNKKTEK